MSTGRTMPVGATIAITAGAAVLLAGGGFLAGRGTAPDDAVPLVEAQTEQLDVLADGMADLVSRTAEPITLDAETRAALAQTPPQCVTVLGGNPLSLACAWATCLQYGQSSAQRPECRAVEAAYLAELPACVEPEPVEPTE
jgi:hypothetical protein